MSYRYAFPSGRLNLSASGSPEEDLLLLQLTTRVRLQKKMNVRKKAVRIEWFVNAKYGQCWPIGFIFAKNRYQFSKPDMDTL
jgi:hypothetical protein